MDTRYEKTSFCVTLTLTDKDGAPLSPVTSVSWWVVKPGAPTLIITKQTVLNPTATVEIVVPDTASLCSGSRNEKRILIIQVESGFEYTKHAQYEWEVLAMDMVPYPT